GFEGVFNYILRKHGETESDTARDRYEAYMREVPCASCDGTRLKPEALAVTVAGTSIADVSRMAIDQAAEFLGGLELSARDARIEPSIGLHQRDNRRLIDTLIKLRDLGNTLIVVEHDEETIDAADWIVDIGPGAGEHGGQVVYSGPVKGLPEAD
ncbi:excinuclease ABC subunit A, partial [Brevibacterium paucivorans]